MIRSAKKLLSVTVVLLLLIGIFPYGFADPDGIELRILYTGDIHSSFQNAGRLKTLIDELRTDNTIYVDSGDIAMGTLLQAGFSTDAFELRLLGKLGCDVVTVGNHEWDYGGYGFAAEMNKAAELRDSGETLPAFVQANLDFSGELTEEQEAVKEALDRFGFSEYTVLDIGGIKTAVFGVIGYEAIDDSPTSGMVFSDYISASSEIVKKIKAEENPDCIICLSHSGTTGDGVTGEDFDLIKAVPDIDVVISGHSHTLYPDAIVRDGTVLVSSGSNMEQLGKLDLIIGKDGISVAGNELIPIDESIPSDPETDALLSSFNAHIADTYLSDYGVTPDQVIAHSSIDFMPLDDMYASHQEYPMGNLIADSYFYEAERNGITDIDVALVGLGTIRGSFSQGDITVGDAFEICSLGVGGDGSAGHPLLGGYATGKDLKLLCELDASLGAFVSSIKMSYSGLNVKYNEKRIIMDRVTDIQLVRRDGSTEPIENDRLYRFAANMYAANMLGMVNDLTKGILKITIRGKDGNPVDDLYSLALKDENGTEIKEWVAFMNYLHSFDEKNGIPEIPEELYSAPLGRKIKSSDGSLSAVLSSPGVAVWIAAALILIVLLLLFLLCLLIRTAVRAIIRAKRRRSGKSSE